MNRNGLASLTTKWVRHLCLAHTAARRVMRARQMVLNPETAHWPEASQPQARAMLRICMRLLTPEAM